MPGRSVKHVSVVAVIAIPLIFAAGRHNLRAPACSFPLPRTAEIGEPAFEKALYAFLEQGCYRDWKRDSLIRNTGPFLDNKNFGTHPAVRVYYSPDVWDWLTVRKRAGAIADGAMIVKEMFPSPAQQGATLTGWTVMVKESGASRDGWYWSYHAPNEAPDNPRDYPDSGFGLYCVRCHASAEAELTFASVGNTGANPLTFMVQVPTMPPAQAPDFHSSVAAASESAALSVARAHPNADIVALYKLAADRLGTPRALPPESFDHVVARAKGPQMFVTSDQCLGCHSASSINMALYSADPNQPPVNLSPYTEWRASMMGLAGRDPVFHAQLESEKARHPAKTQFFDQTCYRCHGVMGRRQIELDGRGEFKHEMIYAQPGTHDAVYGALARDGVSCAACHRISPEGLGTTSTYTGQFKTGPADSLYGPYDEVATLPMKQALGITPKGGAQISASALCGSCHTVILPVFDRNGKKIKDIYEQTTYLEWRNSVYQNERQPVSADAQACHDCHMPRTYGGRKLTFRVANVEDGTYPAADHRAPDAQLEARPRDQYSRHMLMGINVFTLTMFRQFPDLLGIRTSDYMFGAGIPGLVTAEASALELARNQTATIEIPSITPRGNAVDVNVRVTNKAGHGLPSGVEFRRAFIELTVTGADGTVRWASGRTSPLGVILEGRSDRALRTEFMRDPATGKATWQPHHQVIEREDQVQIYEELVTDTDGHVTTSFVSLFRHVKENRLQPRGWRSDGPDAELTRPEFEAARDPDYRDGSGADALVYRIPAAAFAGGATVSATLWYQALPPYYLAQRFGGSNGPETDRLAWIMTRLKLDGTPVENWKLHIAGTTRRID